MLFADHGKKASVTAWRDRSSATGDRVIPLLNRALATELVCALRYKQHYFLAQGVYSDAVSRQLLERCRDEETHADLLAERIVQLGGTPDFDPSGLAARSQVRYEGDVCLLHVVEEDLLAEQIAIDTYRELIVEIGHRDVVTRRILERILTAEEQHSEGLGVLLADPRLMVDGYKTPARI